MGRQVNIVVEFECDICGLSVVAGGSCRSGFDWQEPAGWHRPESMLQWWCPECMAAWQKASDDAKDRVKAIRCGLNRGGRGD